MSFCDCFSLLMVGVKFNIRNEMEGNDCILNACPSNRWGLFERCQLWFDSSRLLLSLWWLHHIRGFILLPIIRKRHMKDFASYFFWWFESNTVWWVMLKQCNSATTEARPRSDLWFARAIPHFEFHERRNTCQTLVIMTHVRQFRPTRRTNSLLPSHLKRSNWNFVTNDFKIIWNHALLRRWIIFQGAVFRVGNTWIITNLQSKMI